jgi:2-polyprenyl-3-methyl-5-hydroxy-6-metoxy-1,4-benzoquinol methylase
MITTAQKTPFDPQRAEAFGQKLLDMLNAGAVSLMVSIGHRTRLFDVMADLAPSTSREIAAAAALDERYVREWLGAMTVAGIVHCDVSSTRYHLPAEHAASLCRSAPEANLSIYAQYVGVMGSVENDVVHCFTHGGGVPYERFDRFHEVMAEDSGQTVLPVLLEGILPLAHGVTERLREGIDVLDIGCGRGHALHLLARAFPGSRFVGMDLSAEAIAHARAQAAEHGLDNVRFEARDLTDAGELGSFDLITAFDAVHDQKSPASVLSSVARSLAPDGTFLMQDIAGSCHVHNNLEHPIAPLLYTVSCMHCMTVSLAQGGDGLGAMWGEEKALEMLRQAGFHHVEKKTLPHDIQNNYYVARIGAGNGRSAS